MLAILALERLGQEGYHQSEVSPDCIVSARLAGSK